MVLNKRFTRVLLENKAQYAGSIVLIALVCLLFTGMTLTGANLRRLTDEFTGGTMQEDASFTTKTPIGDVKALEAQTDAVIEEGQVFDATLAEGPTLRIFRQNETLNLPAIIEGRALSGKGEILLNPLFAQAHGYQIGNVITILNQPFKIMGYVGLPNYMYPLRSDTDLVFSAQKFGIGVIGAADFAAFHQGNSFYAVKYNHPDKEHPRSQARQFRSLLVGKGTGVGQWTDIIDNKRVRTVELKIQSLNLMSRAMPLGLLLLTCIMVGNVLGRMISRESAIIGAWYALGYRKSEIYRHYLVLPLLLALIGGVIGTSLGLFTVHPIATFMTSTFSIPMPGINIDPMVMLLSLFLPVFFLSGSGFFVIWKQLRHSPVALMRGTAEANQVNFLERALHLDKLSFAAKFRIREQLRSLSRLVFLLVGCAVATMLLLYGFTIKSSLDYALTTNITGTFHFQHEYVFTQPHTEKPPEGAKPFSPALFLPEGNETFSFYMVGVTPNSDILTLTQLPQLAKPVARIVLSES